MVYDGAMAGDPTRQTLPRDKRDAARELIVLGLLRRAPMSAYFVDRTMRNHAPLYRPFKFGNTYHFIDALADAGLLKARSAAAKRGPSRTKHVFSLSAHGESRFRTLLAETLADVQASDVALETALVLLGQLSRREAMALLELRLKALGEHEARLQRLWGGFRTRRGAAYLAASHHVQRLKGERRFVDDAIRRLEDQRWSREWTENDGAISEPSRAL